MEASSTVINMGATDSLVVRGDNFKLGTRLIFEPPLDKGFDMRVRRCRTNQDRSINLRNTRLRHSIGACCSILLARMVEMVCQRCCLSSTSGRRVLLFLPLNLRARLLTPTALLSTLLPHTQVFSRTEIDIYPKSVMGQATSTWRTGPGPLTVVAVDTGAGVVQVNADDGGVVVAMVQ